MEEGRRDDRKKTAEEKGWEEGGREEYSKQIIISLENQIKERERGGWITIFRRKRERKIKA